MLTIKKTVVDYMCICIKNIYIYTSMMFLLRSDLPPDKTTRKLSISLLSLHLPM